MLLLVIALAAFERISDSVFYADDKGITL